MCIPCGGCPMSLELQYVDAIRQYCSSAIDSSGEAQRENHEMCRGMVNEYLADERVPDSERKEAIKIIFNAGDGTIGCKACRDMRDYVSALLEGDINSKNKIESEVGVC